MALLVLLEKYEFFPSPAYFKNCLKINVYCKCHILPDTEEASFVLANRHVTGLVSLSGAYDDKPHAFGLYAILAPVLKQNT